MKNKQGLPGIAWDDSNDVFKSIEMLKSILLEQITKVC